LCRKLFIKQNILIEVKFSHKQYHILIQNIFLSNLIAKDYDSLNLLLKLNAFLIFHILLI